MNSSSDTDLNITNDLLRSFKEYSCSDLDSSGSCNVQAQNRHPLSAAINTVMGHKAKFYETLNSAAHISDILNNVPNAIVQTPTNKQILKRKTNMRFTRKYILFCDTCDEMCDDGWCSTCELKTKKRKSNFMIYIPLEQQIKYSLNKHFELISDYLNRPKNRSICDIDDGAHYKNVCCENKGDTVLSFTLNTDGVQPYRSKKNSIWPVQLYQNFLPPTIRYKPENVLLCSLYFGAKKPNMNKILHHLATEIDWMQRNRVKFMRSGKLFQCIPIVMYCSADLPARAMLSGLKTYSGSNACTACVHEGLTITDRTGGKYTRYVKVNPEPEARSHNKFLSAAVNFNELSPNERYGLITVPPMILFPQFDFSKGFVIDYMHNIALGVMRLLLDLWMGCHRLSNKSKSLKPMTKKNRDKLDKRLLSLQPPEYITRKPRSVQERGFYKASEYRNLLLYFLPYALRGLLDESKVKHFQLLSAATYILLQSELNENEINQAGEMLTTFADRFEEIYGKETVTMNVHILRHYAETVKNCGPIWAYSMFSFEKKMGFVTKAVKNSTDSLETISFHYCMDRIEPTPTNNEIRMIRPKEMKISENERKIIFESGVKSCSDVLIVSDSINLRGHLFKSIRSIKTKSIDHFIQMKNGDIGAVQMYIQLSGNLYVILICYEIVEREHHLLRIKPNDQFKIYLCSEICSKLIYMKFGCFEIVSKEPNFFETR